MIILFEPFYSHTKIKNQFKKQFEKVIANPRKGYYKLLMSVDRCYDEHCISVSMILYNPSGSINIQAIVYQENNLGDSLEYDLMKSAQELFETKVKNWFKDYINCDYIKFIPEVQTRTICHTELYYMMFKRFKYEY